MTRIMPCLLLKNESLVKSIQFTNYKYIGDPINTVRIFNEMEVDELIFLDISATTENRSPSFKIFCNCIFIISPFPGITIIYYFLSNAK